MTYRITLVLRCTHRERARLTLLSLSEASTYLLGHSWPSRNTWRRLRCCLLLGAERDGLRLRGVASFLSRTLAPSCSSRDQPLASSRVAMWKRLLLPALLLWTSAPPSPAAATVQDVLADSLIESISNGTVLLVFHSPGDAPMLLALRLCQAVGGALHQRPLAHGVTHLVRNSISPGPDLLVGPGCG